MNEKLTIQQVAAATQLSVYTLRYYERIGLIHTIDRADNSHRRYTEADIGWIDFLNKLRATGMTIRQMQVYAELQRQGDATLPQRVEILKDVRANLESHIECLQGHLDALCGKISFYEERLAEPVSESW
jgi:DNA-binding transcriptional MerR regulator